MTALALILSYVETLIPVNFGIPGAKLGLANLVTVLILFRQGWRDAFLLAVARILLSGFIFGSLSAILYSLAGGILSLAGMTALKKTDAFSVAGVSVAGGVLHNIGQLLTAMFAVQTYQVGYYLPFLLLAGAATGFLTGIISREVLKRIRNIRI